MQPPPDPDDLEALRRRVYAPDPSAADVARYRAATAAPPVEAAEPQQPAPRPRRRRILWLSAAAVVLVAAGAATVLLTTAHGRARPSAQAPAALTIPATARTAFVDHLDGGAPAGLATYFYDHPDARPDALKTTTRADTEEYRGSGPRALDLSPSALAFGGGRMTVVLVLARSGSGGWTAGRVASGGFEQTTLTSRAGAQLPGLPTSATVRYRAPAPTLLDVHVPAGVRWGALVVFSD